MNLFTRNEMNNNIFSEHYSFLFFCGEEFFLILSREINDYAAQQLADVRRKILKSDSWWRPLVVDEMKTYFALYILMRRVKKIKCKTLLDQTTITNITNNFTFIV